ncbi:MAG: DUF2269 family protein, partial [Actinobacteria bacterium]|nr:DUF2269 family protein [Actinomycetota bacterium]
MNTIRRSAGARRAPRRPWYSTEQRVTSSRTSGVVPRAPRPSPRGPVHAPAAPASYDSSRTRAETHRTTTHELGGTVVLGAIDSDAYKIVLTIHILTVVIGIGAVMLNGLYGAQAKARKGPEGLAIAEANFRVSMIAEYFIYAIPVFGIGLVFMSKTDGVQVYDWDQTWIWLSILLYIVALGISHGMVIPTAKRMQVLMKELNAMGPPPGAGGPGGHPGGAPA